MAYKDFDYYTILGIDRSADTETVKTAYRMLARLYHPDSPEYNPSPDLAFHDIDEAYEVLRDPVERAKYDANAQISFPRPKPESSQAWRFAYATPIASTPTAISDDAASTDMWKVFSQLAAVVFAMLACGLLIWLASLPEADAPSDGWARTSGTVTNVTEQQNCDAKATNCFYVFYSYAVDGDSYRDYAPQTSNTYDVDDDITIEYKLDNPERNVIAKPRSTSPSNRDELIVVMLFVIVGLGFLSWIGAHHRQRHAQNVTQHLSVIGFQ